LSDQVSVLQVRRFSLSGLWARYTFMLLVTAIILMWPTIWNGSPVFLSDTMTYIRGADAAVFQATGSSTHWSDQYFQRFGPALTSSDETSTTVRGAGTPVVISGRSIYYGAFLYVSERVGTLSLASYIQSLVCTIILFLLHRRDLKDSKQSIYNFLVFACVLSIASPLAYFTSYITPDVFTGVGIISAGALTFLNQLNKGMFRIFWFLLLCASILFHSSNLIIILIITALLLLLNLRYYSVRAENLSLLLASLFIGVVGELAFSAGVKAATGESPVRPPFIMARIIADGPGREFLREKCPTDRFHVCKYIERLPADGPGSDAFLWSKDNVSGVFSAASFDERRLISRQEPQFVLAVLSDRPIDLLFSTLSSISRQASKWSLPEFNHSESERMEFQQRLPPNVYKAYSSTKSFESSLPVSVTESLTLPTVALSLLVSMLLLRSKSIHPRLKAFVLLLWLGVLMNLVVCGAISTPHDRYSMRVSWLVPLGTWLMLMDRWTRRRAVADPTSTSSLAIAR
jgi:hypothetical protein